jgi:perosamine synthetase
MKRVPHNRPTLGREEEDAAISVLRSGWIAQGKEVKYFEDDLCHFLGLPDGHAVAVSSGTAALYLALWVMNARKKKVAYPVYGCSALRNAVAMCDANGIVLDTAPNSPNIEPASLEGCGADIAIVAHIFGIPVDISTVRNMDVIEDCAQALGARVRGKSVGFYGKAGIFSFYATKLITSGGGGGLFVSRDRALADEVRNYREFDARKDDKIRFNFQMTDLQAAIGRVQLKKLPAFIKRRSDIFDRYREAGIKLLNTHDKDSQPVRYRGVVSTQVPGKIIEALESAGISAIVPNEDWELLGEPEKFPFALKLSRETVSLPLYPTLTDEEVELIISVVMKQ